MRSIGDRSFYDTVEEMTAPGRAALIVVDMQNDYTHPDGYYAHKGLNLSFIQETVEPIRQLAAAAREAHVPVIYTQHTILPGFTSDSPVWLGIHAAGGLESLEQTDFYTLDGTWGHEIVTELQPQPGDIVLKKFRSNCFVGTGLDTLLRSGRYETLIVTGQVTQGCVENTVRTARDLDYYAVMVSNAVASTSKEAHDATFANLGRRLPCPAAAEIIAGWVARERTAVT